MLFLFLLPLLLPPSLGEHCSSLVQELRQEVSALRAQLREDRRREEEVAARLEVLEARLDREGERRTTLEAEVEAREEVPSVLMCAYQDIWNDEMSTVTYDSFLSNFNNADKPGGGDGQLDLATGVFTCLTTGKSCHNNELCLKVVFVQLRVVEPNPLPWRRGFVQHIVDPPKGRVNKNTANYSLFVDKGVRGPQRGSNIIN